MFDQIHQRSFSSRLLNLLRSHPPSSSNTYSTISPTSSCFHHHLLHPSLNPHPYPSQPIFRSQSTTTFPPNPSKLHFNRGYQFISAASFIGKPTSNPPTTIDHSSRSKYQHWVHSQKTRWSQAYLTRHPRQPPPSFELLTNSGHDWWFIRPSSAENPLVGLGVADGVGGWEDSGLDPAEVAQSLMFYADEVLGQADGPGDPRMVLSKAYDRMSLDKAVRGGASTALVALLDPTLGTISWANLGDSSLLVLKRAGETLGLQSRNQTHYFNCPYQLTKFPASFTPSDRFVTDSPSSASVGSANLNDHDLVLLFTDGIGDNLWPDELAAIARSVFSKGLADAELVQEIAHTICAYARVASFQPKRVTPFEVEARRNKIDDMNGGKVDDITLVVSLVRQIKR